MGGLKTIIFIMGDVDFMLPFIFSSQITCDICFFYEDVSCLLLNQVIYLKYHLNISKLDYLWQENTLIALPYKSL